MQSSFVRRRFGDEVGNISGEGVRVEDMNPPLPLDMRAESRYLRARI